MGVLNRASVSESRPVARKLAFSLATLIGTVALMANGTGAFAATSPQLPLPYHGSAGQVITVVATNSHATTATLTMWQRVGSSWRAVSSPVIAFVGRDGIGQASETSAHTPAGAWTLTEAFGRQPNDGTRLPYRQVNNSSWWVSDVRSPLYNKYYSCRPGTCPFDETAGENLGMAGTVYNHAVVIDYNRKPIIPGAGSAFFLHISAGKPTAGCVAIPADSLRKVMTWLDPKQHPMIVIGVKQRS